MGSRNHGPVPYGWKERILYWTPAISLFLTCYAIQWVTIGSVVALTRAWTECVSGCSWGGVGYGCSFMSWRLEKHFTCSVTLIPAASNTFATRSL